MSASSFLTYFGTYTPAGGASRGIYAATLANGKFSEVKLAAETAAPTFLAWHPNGQTLYALGEAGTVNGKAGGALVAFRRDATSGTLMRLNAEATGGGPLAHLAVDATGRVAVAISYHASEVSSFPLRADGSLGPKASLLKQNGALGPNAARQEKPHPHSVTFSPDNRFVYICDLGLDRIFRYRFDLATAVLTPDGETATSPGAGPRHAKFSRDGKFLHVINELNGSISTYAANLATGELTHVQTVPTLPADFTGTNTCAEIRLSADERFVYGSNRGHDSLVAYARDPAQGTLTLVQTIASGGKHPRNFNLTPDGAWLICANKDSDNVVVFRVDAATGKLAPVGTPVAVPQAVCVLFKL